MHPYEMLVALLQPEVVVVVIEKAMWTLKVVDQPEKMVLATVELQLESEHPTQH